MATRAGPASINFQKNGTLRQHPLVPGNDPLSVLTTLEKSPQWICPGQPGKGEYDWYKGLLATQLLQLIDTVYHVEPNEHGGLMPNSHFDQQVWDKAVKDIAALHIQWDPAKNIYVFADGTSLPVVKPPIYERQIWEIPQLGAQAQLVIERQSKDTILLILQHNEYKASRSPPPTSRSTAPPQKETLRRIPHQILPRRPQRGRIPINPTKKKNSPPEKPFRPKSPPAAKP